MTEPMQLPTLDVKQHDLAGQAAALKEWTQAILANREALLRSGAITHESNTNFPNKVSLSNDGYLLVGGETDLPMVAEITYAQGFKGQIILDGDLKRYPIYRKSIESILAYLGYQPPVDQEQEKAKK
ncbi:hypothetical protein COY07_05540 [Candidatus Peregrinibacteria bacterium CG_4_10_14_0_2_um_filter_43_11]|nr:MAG: hypothetical protein COY07_05540 [Candidatus Peregrinibacteria bacterium CG_4_10_14_0_2_um_filter_43_11]